MRAWWRADAHARVTVARARVEPVMDEAAHAQEAVAPAPHPAIFEDRRLGELVDPREQRQRLARGAVPIGVRYESGAIGVRYEFVAFVPDPDSCQ
jgi:hypothetical protein